MNKVILIGRLVAEPEIRTTNTQEPTPLTIARYTLAVDRKFKRDGQPDADFVRCTVWGKGAEFAEKYLHKGMKIAVVGRIQTGSYDKDGQKVYTTDVIVEEQEFCEKKGEGAAVSVPDQAAGQQTGADGFMPIPDDLEELPFA